MAAGRDAARSCIYCGRPITTGHACSAHRDLLDLDPAHIASRRALTDTEQGARSPYRVPRRGGRSELY